MHIQGHMHIIGIFCYYAYDQTDTGFYLINNSAAKNQKLNQLVFLEGLCFKFKFSDFQ